MEIEEETKRKEKEAERKQEFFEEHGHSDDWEEDWENLKDFNPSDLRNSIPKKEEKFNIFSILAAILFLACMVVVIPFLFLTPIGWLILVIFDPFGFIHSK